MKLTDLLIIYFAAGAPFGVYQFTTVQHPLDAKAWLQIFFRICFWPLFAVLGLIDWFAKGDPSAGSHLDQHIDRIRIEIEDLVLANESISSIFDFREILQRYAGLSEATNVAVSSSVNEVFDLSGSENKQLASACLARKNHRKLSFHQSLARSQFVDMISEFADASNDRTSVLELAIELANDVQDALTSEALTEMMYEPQPLEHLSSQFPQTDTNIARSQSASSTI